LPEVTELKVTVAPRAVTSKTLDRNRDSLNYQIDVAVQKKTDINPVALESLITLVKEIADHFLTQPLASYPGACCTEVKN
jgi:hypothetical protein